MSQREARTVVLHSSPDHITNVGAIEARSLRTDATPLPTQDSDTKFQTSKIAFKVSSNDITDNSEVYTAETSTQVIWTCRATTGGAPTEVKVQTNQGVTKTSNVSDEKNNRRDSKNIDGDAGNFKEGKRGSQVSTGFHRKSISQTPTFSEMKTMKYSPIEFGSQHSLTTLGQNQGDTFYSTQISKTSSKSGSTTSYTYKVHDSIAILENVTKRATKIDIKSVSQTRQNGEKSETQTAVQNEEHLLKTRKPVQTTGIEIAIGDETPKQGQDSIHFKEQTTSINKGENIEHIKRYSSSTFDRKSKKQLSAENLPSQPEKTYDLISERRQTKENSIQHSIMIQASAPPKMKKRNPDDWIKHTKAKEELSAEQPGLESKLSTEKIQLHQHQDTLPNIMLRLSTPEKIQSTDSTQYHHAMEGRKISSQSNLQQRKTVKSTTHTTISKHMSKETLQLTGQTLKAFNKQETNTVPQTEIFSPQQLVIGNVKSDISNLPEQKLSPRKKVEKANEEDRNTPPVRTQEVNSQLPFSPTNKLSSEKMQFLQYQEAQTVEKVHVSSPGKLVIPDFNKDRSTEEADGLPSPPKVEKINAEQWITQNIKQEEIRSEMTPPTNKLSADKMQFVHNQETQRDEKHHVSLPGKLVIPDFNQESSSVEVENVSKPPKMEKRNVEEWITQTKKQEEVRSELPLSPTKKLSSEKMQFLQSQETQKVEKLHVPSPGRLVMPDFNKDSSTAQVDGLPSPPKVEKINAEQWITQSIKQQEIRSELPPPTNKLSADKMQFVRNQETQRDEKLHVSLPGKLVIPDFHQETSSVELEKVSRRPKVDQRNEEKWITQTVKQEEVRSELPLSPTKKLSSEKMQLLQSQETQQVEKLHVSLPGRLVMPDFNKDSSTAQVDGLPSPPKVEKINAEQWITQKIKQEEIRSELPPPTNKLSADKMQFVHNQQTQGEEKLHVSFPGKLVIPDFHQETSSVEVEKVSKPPKVEKRNVEEWITQTVKQEEVRSELPLSPTKKLFSEKMQFLQSQETQKVEKLHVSSPGRLVMPDFNKDSSTAQVDGLPSPPKVEKINAEQWITQKIKQEEIRSELPPPTNKLSADKMQFVHNQETQRDEKLHVSFPGKLVIPDIHQETSSVEVEKVSKPPKVEKRNVEEWITQTVKQEEVRSELPLSPTKKLFSEKMQFLQSQETQKVEKLHVSSPGRLVMPDFNKDSSTAQVDGLPSPPKVEKINSEQWITQKIKQEEIRSELPPPTNKLSADKMQFVQNQETQRDEKLHVSLPGKLVIPDFHQETSSVEVEKVSKAPKVEKRNVEECITQTVKQEEVRSELPLSPTKKLSSEKMQFLQSQETQQVEKLHVSLPGRLVMPDFNKDSSTAQVDGLPSPPKVEKINAEQWITQSIKQEEIRSELPPPTNKLSPDKMQFVHNQETQRDEKLHVPLPGKLVIPTFNQEPSSVEVENVSNPPKVEKRNAEEWITQTVKQEEVRSELPLGPTKKLSWEKMQFLQSQETQQVDKLHVSLPGRLMIPDFNKDSSTEEVDGLPSPPKVEKINAEQRITQNIKQEEIRSELPPPTNKLSADKMQFVQNQETQRDEKLHVSSPGRLIIADVHHETSSIEVENVSKPPKVEKRNVEEWKTQTVNQEEVRSELPLSPTEKLSWEKMQLLQSQETQKVEKLHVSSPCKLVIPDFNKDSSTAEVDGIPVPPKPEKINAEQWITQSTKQEEITSELPPPTNKLSADKMQFVHHHERQRDEKRHVSLPGKLVVPDFNQETSSIEVEKVSEPPKMEKRNVEEWITQTVKQEEVRSELPLSPTKKLSSEKMQFLQYQEAQTVEKVHLSSPGRLVIRDFNKDSSTAQVDGLPSPPKVEKINAEQWITESKKQQEIRSELPPKTNKLSPDKMQFVHNQETQPDEKLHVPLPGKLVIPNFNQEPSSVEVEKVSKPPKVEKRNVEEWITHTIKEEEVRSELPLNPTKNLSSEKMQFLQCQETQQVENLHVSSPGRLVMPHFNKDSSTAQVDGLPSPPKVEKINAEQWITQSKKQQEIISELPPPTKKLSADKMQFVRNQKTERDEKLHVSLPGKLVIPNFHQETSSVEVEKVSKPRKVEKRNVEEWITQTVKQDEVKSELSLSPIKKLSSEKMQFLQSQETQKVEKLHVSSPGRLVMPHFNKHSSTAQVDGLPSPPKVEKINAEQWITQKIKQEEIRSELPPPTNKLSADKMQFVHNQETQGDEKLHVSLPGKLIIPDFHQETSSVEVEKVSKPPKVEKRNVEEWITQTVKQEEVRSELPLSPTKKLFSEKMQFLQSQETQKVEKLHVSSPGRLVMPDFNKDSSTAQVDGLPSPPKVEKINAEQWITQKIKQEEIRSELPPPTNKLSADKMQFVQNQETQRDEKLHVSLPGKLVIPDFHQETSSVEVEKVSKAPKVEKRNVEECITQTVKQEEVRSELPLSPTKKLSSEKMQFLQSQETQQVEKLHVSLPGRLVMPDFNKDSSTAQVDGLPSPPKVEKINAEQWITQKIKQEEIRSELPPPTNKLSADKMQFVHNQETQGDEKLHVSLPGKLIIPDFHQETSSVEVKKVSKPPKVEKRNVEEWITQTVKQEEVRSELPLSPTKKLFSEKMQFLQSQETQKVEKLHVSSPGRLIMPAFNKDSSTAQVDGLPSPPKVEKINAEQWITQKIKQEEIRSELPPPTNKLSADKMQFVHNQETQRDEKLHVSFPGKLVIPDFHQETSSVEVEKVSKPPKVEKRNVEEWITQTVKQEEVRSELPLSPTKKLSSEKMQFLQYQEAQTVENVHLSSTGRLVIPDFNKDSCTAEVDGLPSPPKVEKINAEQWITQSIKQEEIRSELPPPTNKLSPDKMQFVHNQETQRDEKLHVPLPGKLVIPTFNQEPSSVEVENVSNPPKVEKRNAEEWITQTVKQEEVRSELPLGPTKKLSWEKMQFLQSQETQQVDKLHVSLPGRLMIPDFNKDSSTEEVDGLPSPPKVEKINAEQRITQNIKQEEIRSELPPPTNKLSADKMQFVQNQETQRDEKLHVSSPGRLIIADVHHETSSIEVENVSKPPKVEKRNVEEWITQTVNQEEVRSELPLSPTEKLSWEKMQLLQSQETQKVEKLHVSSPCKLVIPDFNKDSSTAEVDGIPVPPKPEKINAEQWITQSTKQEEITSELPPPTNKLSADKMQFVHHHERQRDEKRHVSLPGKLVVPDFNQETSSIEVEKVSEPPKMEKRNVEEWITQTVKQEEVRSELPLSPTKKLSSEKMQFLQYQEAQTVEKVHLSSPGRLVIRDFNKDSSTAQADGLPSPPKVEKINAEQWITESKKQQEIRSELPPKTNKLSPDKMQFVHNQETQPDEKLHVPLPGKLVIPNFNQEPSSVEVEKVSKPPKVEKRNVEEWITHTIKEEEVRSELPLNPTKNLSSEKMQFLQCQETQQVENLHVSSPGRLVMPHFNKDSSTAQVDGLPSPPKVEKINAEQWITQSKKQQEIISELPPPTKKLSADKMQFVRNQKTERDEKLHVSLPGKLVIPNFHQETSSVEVEKVSKPRKVEKRNVEEWITQTVKQDEVKSELSLSPIKKLSSEKMQFLQSQETQKVEKLHVSSPGRLVMPHFNKHSSTAQVDGLPSPPKVEKINAEQWITQKIKQEEIRSELPPPTNKLSADKMQFVHNQETQGDEKLHVSLPGKLIIPDFHQETSSVEVEKVSKPPKVEKRNVEEWITQTVKQEEVRSELPLSPTKKLFSEKMQFLQSQETQKVEKLHVSSPGRLIMPAFNKDSSTAQVDGLPSPPKVEKINAEQWITQKIKQEEIRSELPPPTNKLSADKMQFVHNQETQRDEKLHVSFPGKLVIPDFHQETSSVEVEKVSKPPKVDQRNVEEWITQTVKQEEVRSELPLSPTKKLFSEKMQFLQSQETQKVEKLHVSSPGRLVMPDFNKDSSTAQVDGLPSPPKVEKINSEQWITQKIKQEEIRSELPPPTNKLSADKMQFVHNQETQRDEKLHVSFPGKLVIPDFHKETSSVEVEKVSKPPKVEKRNVEEWITQTVKQEEVRSELPLSPTKKLSSEKMQFLQYQEAQTVENVHLSSTGRLVIPDFNKDSCTAEVDGLPSPPKVEKINAEQWITQSIKQEEIRSELPPPTNKLSADKMQFVHNQETQRDEKLHVPLPGKLVIPTFNQEPSSVEVENVSKPPKVEKRNVEEWITHTIKQEEVRSELPLNPTKKLSSEKMQFLQSQETQKVEKLHVSSPGRLVMPDFNKDSSTAQVDGLPSPPKVEKINAEQWITQKIKQEEIRSELPPPTNKLSADTMQIVHNQETLRDEKHHVSLLGKLVIPDFHQETSSVEVEKVSKPPKVEKRNVVEWITQTVKQEEVRSELPLSPTKKLHVSSPGRLVIPNCNKDSSPAEVDGVPSPPKVEKINAEQWIPQSRKEEELRSELPPLTKKLSADKMQFLHNPETQRVEKLHVSSPGKLVIPDFHQETSSVEVEKVSKPPKVEKRNVEEWITQTVKEEEVRSELPLSPTKKLHVSSPGRLVIPNFNKDSSPAEVDGLPSPPKVDKINAEQWITQSSKQEEIRSEVPPSTNKLSADTMQFLHNQETQRVERLHVSSPGKLVIPDFHQETSCVELSSEKVQFLQNQETLEVEKLHVSSPGGLVIAHLHKDTSIVEVDELSSAPKVEKINAEQWLTKSIRQEELRSELPPLTKKLSEDKMQFVHNQETQRVEKRPVSSPGKLVIPDFLQDSSPVEVEELPLPPNGDKINSDTWITQIKKGELYADLSPANDKRSSENMHFQEHQRKRQVEKILVSSHGKMVIPELYKDSSFVEVIKPASPSKVEKISTGQWVTQPIKQEGFRSELPPQRKKLSADKMQFLLTQETHRVEKLPVSSPGKLVIPVFHKDSSPKGVDKLPSPPKDDKINSEIRIMQNITQEELRSELPLSPTNKLSSEKMQYLQNQETHRVENRHILSPGKVVIPDFFQRSSILEGEELPSAPKVENINGEEWTTLDVKEEAQYQYQEAHGTEKLDVSSPDQPVTVDVNDGVCYIQVEDAPRLSKLEKGNSLECISERSSDEEPRCNVAHLVNKHSAEKIKFILVQEKQPGKLVIPDFGVQNVSDEVQKVDLSLQVDITQTTSHEERKSGRVVQTNRLSAEKLEFGQSQETQPGGTSTSYTPGKPDFNQHSIEVRETSPTAKVDKLDVDQYITKTTTHEELRTDVPLQSNKLSQLKLRFINTQDTQSVITSHASSPGKLVIPDFNKETSSTEVKELSPLQKVQKRNAKEWITHSMTREELRTVPLPVRSNHSEHKVEFIRKQETRNVDTVDGFSPGRLVIPNFGNQNFSVQVEEVPRPPSRMEKSNLLKWEPESNTDEELRTEVMRARRELSTNKLQFVQDTQSSRISHGSLPGRIAIPDYGVHTLSFDVQEESVHQRTEHDTQSARISHGSPPGRIAIPDYGVHTLSFDVQEESVHQRTEHDTQSARISHGSPPGKIAIPNYGVHTYSFDVQGFEEQRTEQRNNEQRLKQHVVREKLIAEESPAAERLSTEKLQYVHTEDAESVEMAHRAKPGKLVILDFDQHGTSIQVHEESPPPKVENTWMTHSMTREEIKSLPLPSRNKFSEEKLQFFQSQGTQRRGKSEDGYSPGKLVIPDYGSHSYSTKVQESKDNKQAWKASTISSGEHRSVQPSQTNTLPTDQVQFRQIQENQHEEKVGRSLPGKLVIPAGFH